jgi:hypothetical protein
MSDEELKRLLASLSEEQKFLGFNREVEGVGIRRIVSRDAVAAAPHRIWNAFIDFIATAPAEALSPLQRSAQVAFLYDAEVQTVGICNTSRTAPAVMRLRPSQQ